MWLGAGGLQSVTLSPSYCFHTNLTLLSFSQLISALHGQQTRLFAVMVDCTSKAVTDSRRRECFTDPVKPRCRRAALSATWHKVNGEKKKAEWRGSPPASLDRPQCALSVCRLAGEWRRNSHFCLVAAREMRLSLITAHWKAERGFVSTLTFVWRLRSAAYWTTRRYVTGRNSDHWFTSELDSVESFASIGRRTMAKEFHVIINYRHLF